MKKLAVSILPNTDRIVGFTIPKDGIFFICSHDAVWRALIRPEIEVKAMDNSPYNFIEERNDFLGLVFDGVRENEPLLDVGKNRFSYDFNPKNGAVTVSYMIASQTGEIEFPTFSGDWFAASFSEDGRYLVLAEPYDLAVYDTF